MTGALEVRRPTERVRARNVIRSERSSVELLPPDVDTKVNALRTLDGESQSRAVTAMLSHSRTGLLAAIAAQDLPQIAEFKAKGGAIHEVAKQLRLGKEMQFDAAEFLRRAERGLGVAIRAGQADGTVETKTEASARGSAARDGVLDKLTIKPKPTDFAKSNELSGNISHRDYGIYGMTDGVSDSQFESALVEARDEGALSRSNVSRKCKAKANQSEPKAKPRPVSEAAPPLPAGKKSKGPKANSTEMLENIEGMLGAIVQTCQYIDPADIDPAKGLALVRAVYSHVASIRRTMKEIANA